MPGAVASIQPLPDEVAAQIKSSTTISTLEQVVAELVKNALDASSQKIDITVDFCRGACTIEDDGLGIKPGEFLHTGGLGKAYHTSKSGTPNLHGGEGTFLASLAAMSILTITSHNPAHRSLATLVYHHSRPAARLVPAPARYQLSSREHGTRVDVYDLFGNMPVRVKQRGLTSMREWESICRSIVGLLLAWHTPVSVILRDVGNDRRITLRNKTVHSERSTRDLPYSKPTDLDRLCCVLSQAGFIEPDVRETWIKTSARTPYLTIRGAFSLMPVPTKRVQFLSLGVRYLGPDTGASLLYNEINRIFSLSSFGNSEKLSDDEVAARKSMDRRYKKYGHTNKQLRGTGKGVDRWPMFVIRIELQGQSLGCFGDKDILERESTLSSIAKALAAMATGFLSDNHFRPRTRQSRRHSKSNENAHSTKDRANPTEKASTISSSATMPVPNSMSGVKSMDFSEDTFSNSIRLPKVKVDQDQYPGAAFSGWSRIKSGNGRGFEDGFFIDSNKSHQPEQDMQLYGESASPSISHDLYKQSIPREPVQQLQLPGPPHSLAALTSEDSRNYKEVIDVEADPLQPQLTDNVLTWISPITKAPVLLSARTGQLVAPVMKRPSSAGQSCGERAPSYLRPMASFGGLTRCASVPAIPKAGSWISNFLKDWDNPVFSPATEQEILQASTKGSTLEAANILHGRHRIEKAFDKASSTFSTKFSKADLGNAKIVAQVDKKFILVLMASLPEDEDHQILTLIDQHAADERIRVESLLANLCTPPSPETLHHTPRPAVATTLLPKPMTFQIKAQEHRMFVTHAQHFANWGILYNLTGRVSDLATNRGVDGEANRVVGCSVRSSVESSIVIKYLPPVIAERCRLEPRILIELLRKEIWQRDQDGHSTACPQGILDMLNSRSCRSAIMFNDELSQSECETLVKRLSVCKTPFQCAHGRPSMVPLVAVGTDEGFGVNDQEESEDFGKAWKRWRNGS
ncbi:MAG: hypothetical protein Q9166_002159 [cf. Caloplaca sp. 2 TL-2023]